MIDFADMDDLNENTAAAGVARVSALVPHDITAVKALPAKHEFIEKCPKCMGTGRYRGYSQYGVQCFKCKGDGKLVFATSPEARAKSRAGARKAKERKAENIAEKFAAFEAAHPDIAAWWTNSDFEFAISLRQACAQYGHLSERQLAAAQNCVVKLAAAKAKRAEEQAARAAAAPTVEITNIKASLDRALQSIKNPKILLAGENHAFVFTLAKTHSNNAGAVYVKSKDSGDYLGKIVAGRFMASRDCSAEQTSEIIAVTADPAQSAIAYGKRFGVCSCCGKELTNKVSIDRGIGPICFEKYFGG